MEYLAFVLLGGAASAVSAVFGFGNALLVIALGAHIIPVKDAIVLGTVLFVASTLVKTIQFRSAFDWKMAGVFVVSCLPFTALGALALAYVPADVVKRLLGIVVLAYVVATALERLPSVRLGWRGLIAGSALYGFVSGLLGTGNLVKVILFRELKMSKEAFVGAMAATALPSNVVKLVTYTSSGLVRSDMIWPAVGLAVVGAATAVGGRLVLRKMSSQQFHVGVQVLLAVAAIALLV